MADKNNVKLELIDMHAEIIPLEDNSVDSIVATYTLCVINNLGAAIKEFRGLLKSNGSFIFCEYGLSPDNNVVKWQIGEINF